MTPRIVLRPLRLWTDPTPRVVPSPFSAPWGQTTGLLRSEVTHLRTRMQVDDPIFVDVDIPDEDWRQDGSPRKGARTRSGRIRVRFSSRHGELVYPAAQFPDWQDNVRAVALALEALRKVDRYGLGGGRQYVGFGELPAGRPMSAAMPVETALAVLGLDDQTDWTVDDVEAAFRRAAKAVHPDVGGTDADFKRLAEARALVVGALKDRGR